MAAITALCEQARRQLGQGHRQVDQLVQLCRELGEGMVELSEDDSWAQGQCQCQGQGQGQGQGLQKALGSDISLRGLRSAAVMLTETRQRQQRVHRERRAARAALKQLIHGMLQGVAELGTHAGRFQQVTLAAAMRDRLRPVDHLARFGGEEFAVLMPGAAVDEASQVLTRLQRSLTKALFLPEGREVFVTFSAGVTAWRQGEALEPALERADEALYEAKRTGKNRTCLA